MICKEKEILLMNGGQSNMDDSVFTIAYVPPHGVFAEYR